MDGLKQLAVLYTHNAEQKWEPQQMQHECHDRSLRKERGGGGGGGDAGDRSLKKMVKERTGGRGGSLVA